MAKNVKEKIKNKLDKGIKKISGLSHAEQNADSAMNSENKKLNIFAITTTWLTMVMGEIFFDDTQAQRSRG